MMTPVAITLVGIVLLELSDGRVVSTFDSCIITKCNFMSLEYLLCIVPLGWQRTTGCQVPARRSTTSAQYSQPTLGPYNPPSPTISTRLSTNTQPRHSLIEHCSSHLHQGQQRELPVLQHSALCNLNFARASLSKPLAIIHPSYPRYSPVPQPPVNHPRLTSRLQSFPSSPQ